MMPPRQPDAKGDLKSLSRRERQIIDLLYSLGEATVAEVTARLPDPPTPTAVRSALWLLESRGLVSHRVEGRRNVYRPKTPAGSARMSALKHLVSTFFGGSPVAATVALLGNANDSITDEELDHISELLEKRRKGRKSR